MGGKSSSVSRRTYYVGIHMVLCHGVIDKITKIIIDKKTAWTGNQGQGTLSINAPELFGGNQLEGGIVGDCDLLMGGSGQGVNSYIHKLTGNNNTYRGVVSLVLKQILVGTNYYMKPWAIEAVRIHTRTNGSTQWEDAYAEPLPGTLNGVHIIRECLTDPEWGLGISEGKIGDSFVSSAITAFNEDLGFCFFWNKETSIQDFILEVLKHLQGSLYQDRITGKYELTLIRKVSNPSTILSLNETNIQSVDNFHRLSVGDLPSTVVVKYSNPATGDVNSITVTNPALAQRQSTTITKTIEYLGVTNKALAHRIAIREINQQTVPVLTCSIKCNRDAESLNKGDAFLLTWPDFLDQPIVMRVNTMNLGTPSSSTITIEAIQDVFTAPTVVYTEPDGSNWTDPISLPVPVVDYYLATAPYYFIARLKGDKDAQALDETQAFLIACAKAPNSSSSGASIATSWSGSAYKVQGGFSFCPVIDLGVDCGKSDLTLSITDTGDLAFLAVNTIILIEEEFMVITGKSSTTLSVKRGYLDSIPEVHLAFNKIFGIGTNFGTNGVEYTSGESTNIKLLTKTPKGLLALADAPEITRSFNSRLAKPYPPGNIKFNNTYFPSSVSSLTTLPITFATRNRLLETTSVDTLPSWFDSSVSNESSVSYKYEIRPANNTFNGSSSNYLVAAGTLAIGATTNIPLVVDYVEITTGGYGIYAMSQETGYSSLDTDYLWILVNKEQTADALSMDTEVIGMNLTLINMTPSICNGTFAINSVVVSSGNPNNRWYIVYVPGSSAEAAITDPTFKQITYPLTGSGKGTVTRRVFDGDVIFSAKAFNSTTSLNSEQTFIHTLHF